MPATCKKVIDEGTVTTGTTQEKYNKFTEVIETLMYECFQRANKCPQNNVNSINVMGKRHLHLVKLINELAKKGKAQRAVAKKYQEVVLALSTETVTKQRAERLKQVVNDMTIDGQFNSQKFWKLKSHTM